MSTLLLFSISSFSYRMSISHRSGMSDELSYPASPNHPPQEVGPDGKDAAPTQTQSLDRAYRPPASSGAPSGARQHSLGRVPSHHPPPPTDAALNGPRPTSAKDYRSELTHLTLLQI